MTPDPDWFYHLPKVGIKEELTCSTRLFGSEEDFYSLWNDIINPHWLQNLAVAGGVSNRQFSLTTCAIARLCLPLIPENEVRPRIAVETAEAWARGEATKEQVVRAEEAAFSSYVHTHNTQLIIQYATLTAYNAAYYTHTNLRLHGAYSAYHALLAGIGSQDICATLRKHLPFERPPRPKGLTVWQRLAEVGDE